MRLMKMNQDRHDLADTQTSFPLPLDLTCQQQLSSPDRQKFLAEVIDITE
jgi:hypothetical protein